MRDTQLDIPIKTIVKICATILVVFAIIQLAPLIGLMVIALILAVSLKPILNRLEKWMPRWLGISIVGMAILTVILGVCFGIFPTLVTQISNVASTAPHYIKNNFEHFRLGRAIYAYVESHLTEGGEGAPGPWVEKLLGASQMALSGVGSFLLVYVFTLYFLADGRRTYDWSLAFFKNETRAKIERTASQVSLVVSAYVLGQLITSVIATIYIYVVLRTLGVPAPLMLAVLAGLFDVLPVLGFFLSVIPSIFFAFTVSPTTALLVLGFYVLYHGIENYLILPFVYGNRLRLSGLVVVFSLLAAGLLGGILGALIILPIVASYPIVENIWLGDYLGTRVLKEHKDEDSSPEIKSSAANFKGWSRPAPQK